MPSSDDSAGDPPKHFLRKQEPKWWLITPLMFAFLPLLRHAMKGHKYQNHVFGGAVLLGLIHGFRTMASTLPEEAEEGGGRPPSLR